MPVRAVVARHMPAEVHTHLLCTALPGSVHACAHRVKWEPQPLLQLQLALQLPVLFQELRWCIAHGMHDSGHTRLHVGMHRHRDG